MPRFLVAVFALALFADLSWAAEDILQLRTGGIAVGEVIAVDETGVTLRTEQGEVRFDWEALTPLTRYEVRSDHSDPADPRVRAELASFCLDHGLYPHARREIATARGLGGFPPSELDALAAAVDQAEADEFFARIDQLVAEEEFGRAIEEVRRYLIQAPQSEHTARARALVPDLLRRKDALALRLEEEEKARDELERQEQLDERIAKLLSEAAARRAAAAEATAEAIRYQEIGNVTRTRKAWLTAEEELLAAHATLRRVQRLARRGVAAEKAEQDLVAIRGKLVEVCLGMTRLFLADRNYKSATVWVNKALYLDPVNRAALDMRREINENRLRRKLSGFTNTVPGRGK